MSNNYKLSIIIPVAADCNANYINFLIPKLLKTKPAKSEVIVVYAGIRNEPVLKKYQGNITLISAGETSSASHSRNIGIKKSSGEFFTFLDIDDDFEPKILNSMLKLVEKTTSDLCIANYDEINEKKQKSTKSKYTYSNLAKDNLKLYLTDKISPAVWDKIYRRSTFEETLFDESLTVGEDILYILDIFLKNPKTVFIDDVYYHYIQHQKSIMHTIDQHLLEFLELPKKLSKTELAIVNTLPEEWSFFKLEMYVRTVHSISNNVASSNKAKKYLKQIYDKKTLKKIRKNHLFSKSVRLEMFFLENLGINFHLFLMPIYKKFKTIIRH